jgi:hypothetical protein
VPLRSRRDVEELLDVDLLIDVADTRVPRP